MTRNVPKPFEPREERKGRFRKRAVLANIICPRPGFWCRGTSACTLVAEHPNVPSFRFLVRGDIRQNHPFGNHPFCEPLRTPHTKHKLTSAFITRMCRDYHTGSLHVTECPITLFPVLHGVPVTVWPEPFPCVWTCERNAAIYETVAFAI